MSARGPVLTSAGRAAGCQRLQHACSALRARAVAGALQRLPQAADDEAAHQGRIAEAHFGLGRMHVDIDGARIELDEDRQQRVTALRHQVAVRRAHGAEQQAVAHRPAVDEQELQAAVGPVQRGQARKADHAHAVALTVERAAHHPETRAP